MEKKQIEEFEVDKEVLTNDDLRRSIFGNLTREELSKYEDENGIIHFGSEEEVQDENHPATFAVVTGKGNHQMVNLSGRVVSIYSSNTLTGSTVGKLNKLESYALRGKYDNQRDAWYINFLNSSGGKGTGWYKGTNGCTYWKSKPLSTEKHGDSQGNLYGYFIGTIRTYNVKKNTNIYDGTGKNVIFNLYAGDKVGILVDYGCMSGTNYPDFMKVSAVFLNNGQHNNPSKKWIPLAWATSNKSPGANGTIHETGWIDTQWLHSSSNPAIRGNW